MKKSLSQRELRKVQQCLAAAVLLSPGERVTYLSNQAPQLSDSSRIAFAPTIGLAAIEVAEEFQKAETASLEASGEFRQQQLNYLGIAAEQAGICTWNVQLGKPATLENQKKALKLINKLFSSNSYNSLRSCDQLKVLEKFTDRVNCNGFEAVAAITKVDHVRNMLNVLEARNSVGSIYMRLGKNNLPQAAKGPLAKALRELRLKIDSLLGPNAPAPQVVAKPAPAKSAQKLGSSRKGPKRLTPEQIRVQQAGGRGIFIAS